MNHLQESVIIDFVEQRLSEADAASCGAHLEACSVCAEVYHFWWHFHSTITSERLADAAEQLIQRCIGIFPGAPPESGFRQVIGQIVFDALLQPAAALAIRGEADARQMVFHVEDVDIHLRISGTGSRQAIQGQILPRGDETAITGAYVTLLALGRATLSTTSDRFGVFDFRDVPKAPLIMSINLQSSRLVGVLSITEANIGG
jgi:hypothetical protein